jgi:hypothetical protein
VRLALGLGVFRQQVEGVHDGVPQLVRERKPDPVAGGRVGVDEEPTDRIPHRLHVGGGDGVVSEVDRYDHASRGLDSVRDIVDRPWRQPPRTTHFGGGLGRRIEDHVGVREPRRRVDVDVLKDPDGDESCEVQPCPDRRLRLADRRLRLR